MWVGGQCILSLLHQIKIMHINPWFWRFSLFCYEPVQHIYFLLNYCTAQCTVQGEYLWVLIYGVMSNIVIFIEKCWYFDFLVPGDQIRSLRHRHLIDTLGSWRSRYYTHTGPYHLHHLWCDNNDHLESLGNLCCCHT